jgi:hypothetical protein
VTHIPNKDESAWGGPNLPEGSTPHQKSWLTVTLAFGIWMVIGPV